jgi:multicomponent Na+:H+ antiporter subunit E
MTGIRGCRFRAVARAGVMKKSLWTAVILIAIWWVLSGRFDLLHFGTGVVAALLIAFNTRAVTDPSHWRLGRFLLYLPWIIGQIVLSNLRVARLVFSPRMPIQPQFILKPPEVVGARALTTLGLSTTLTPGTLTVDIDGEEMFVHALDAQSAQDVREGVIPRRVARVFVDPGA